MHKDSVEGASPLAPAQLALALWTVGQLADAPSLDHKEVRLGGLRPLWRIADRAADRRAATTNEGPGNGNTLSVTDGDEAFLNGRCGGAAKRAGDNRLFTIRAGERDARPNESATSERQRRRDETRF
eukprot:2736534-Pyramimonas_sp.AAC.1